MKKRANSVKRGAWQERMFDEKCNENNNYTQKRRCILKKRKTKTRRICLQRMWHINLSIKVKRCFMYVTKWHFSCSIEKKIDACNFRVHHFGK